MSTVTAIWGNGKSVPPPSREISPWVARSEIKVPSAVNPSLSKVLAVKPAEGQKTHRCVKFSQ